jgi:NAD(P)H-hydrate epimerase
VEEEVPTLNLEQTQTMDRLLVESYGIAPLQWLENGGRALALVAKIMLEDDLVDRPVVVLAGRGHNGAGGLVAARHLLNWGAWVQVVCTHPTDEIEGVAAHELHTLQMMGAPLAWAEEGWELPPCDLVIDAIVGLGLRGEVEGKARDLIQLANSIIAPILSLEVPSGVDGWSGTCHTPHIQAAATLALALPKAGLLVDAARLACGELYVGDVGVPLSLYSELGLEVDPFFGRDPLLRWNVVEGIARLTNEL